MAQRAAHKWAGKCLSNSQRQERAKNTNPVAAAELGEAAATDTDVQYTRSSAFMEAIRLIVHAEIPRNSSTNSNAVAMM